MNRGNANTNDNSFNNMLVSLGATIAYDAVKQVRDADEAWNQIRNMVTLARSQGKEQAEQAYDHLFEKGTKMIDRKPLWYRKAKRIIKLALQYDVDFGKLSLRDTERAVAEVRQSQRTDKDREADSLRMLQRTFKGAMERTGQAKVLASLESVLPAQEAPKRAARKRTAAPRAAVTKR